MVSEKIFFLFWSTVIGGGWTQNDEATTHFTAIIDDLTLGFKFIKENFGNFYYMYKKINFNHDVIGSIII